MKKIVCVFILFLARATQLECAYNFFLIPHVKSAKIIKNKLKGTEFVWLLLLPSGPVRVNGPGFGVFQSM